MEEIWKDVPSVPELMASSFGRIKLKPFTHYTHLGGVREYKNLKPRIGREQLKSTGRKGVPKRRQIYITRLKKAFSVHRLVCEAFHGPQPPDKPIVIHIDENPSHNNPENLKWGTQKENLNMPKAKAAFKARIGDLSPRAIWARNKKGN